jgi:hypothetical protein
MELAWELKATCGTSRTSTVEGSKREQGAATSLHTDICHVSGFRVWMQIRDYAKNADKNVMHGQNSKIIQIIRPIETYTLR